MKEGITILSPFSRPKKVISFRASRNSPTRFMLQECSYVSLHYWQLIRWIHTQSFHCDRRDFERNGNVKFSWSIWIHISIAEVLGTRTVVLVGSPDNNGMSFAVSRIHSKYIVIGEAKPALRPTTTYYAIFYSKSRKIPINMGLGSRLLPFLQAFIWLSTQTIQSIECDHPKNMLHVA